MIKCKKCGEEFPKEKEKYHEFQECKGYEGLDMGEDTKFAYEFWEQMNEEDEILQKDEELARKLQEEEDKKSRMLMKKKRKKNKK